MKPDNRVVRTCIGKDSRTQPRPQRAGQHPEDLLGAGLHVFGHVDDGARARAGLGGDAGHAGGAQLQLGHAVSVPLAHAQRHVPGERGQKRGRRGWMGRDAPQMVQILRRMGGILAIGQPPHPFGREPRRLGGQERRLGAGVQVRLPEPRVPARRAPKGRASGRGRGPARGPPRTRAGSRPRRACRPPSPCGSCPRAGAGRPTRPGRPSRRNSDGTPRARPRPTGPRSARSGRSPGRSRSWARGRAARGHRAFLAHRVAAVGRGDPFSPVSFVVRASRSTCTGFATRSLSTRRIHRTPMLRSAFSMSNPRPRPVALGRFEGRSCAPVALE